MRPFWLLAIGLGVGFIVATGRAEAMLTALFSDAGVAQSGSPSSPSIALCIPGQHWDDLQAKCVPDSTTNPTPNPTQCGPNCHLNTLTGLCVPNDPSVLRCYPQNP